MKPPCLVYEDGHLLVVNKPPGLNTHAPSPFAGEGLYEWLRHREPRWAQLAIIHRLDKETSGLIVFSKTAEANRSLTEQFTHRHVKKTYVLLTNRSIASRAFTLRTRLVRIGDRYISRSSESGAQIAETRFRELEVPAPGQQEQRVLWQAEPVTGRTHQIRVHAAEAGIPILGDVRYGGTPARRLCLHAAELRFAHPVSQEELRFHAPADFLANPTLSLRQALIDPRSTTAFRLVHGQSDGWPGCYVDVLGPYLLAQSAQALTREQSATLAELAAGMTSKAAYYKRLVTSPRAVEQSEVSPKLLFGSPAPERFTVLENSLTFELCFNEGYSVGLFLDQRDNRRRLLSGHVAAGFELFEIDQLNSASKPEVLNAFAYTCGFSVCAAKRGALTTSLDLSKKYLEWGKRNFLANGIDVAGHDFVFGDVFDWLGRFNKRSRRFDVILLDPPTFSRSKEFGPFRASKDYSKLVAAALPLLKTGGVLFASCNTAAWPPEEFLKSIKTPVHAAKRAILQEQYFPQPPDFPVSRAEPAYLKTVWLRAR
ncbi:MAG TPA: pseudouridine synthase [Verrucomicrobiae bacterium]|nr:pseudouridine synthase [Verrucomicrobiae bacterium]